MQFSTIFTIFTSALAVSAIAVPEPFKGGGNHPTCADIGRK
jgi:hypothetical protein